MKHKKLFAILLSLAIMVTFMPTMAFADTGNVNGKVVWADGCNSVTITSGGVSTTYSSIKKVQAENGLWHAMLDSTAYAYAVPEADAYYWDLNGAKLGIRKNGSNIALPTNFTHEQFAGYLNSSSVASFAVKKTTGFSNYQTARVNGIWTGVFTGYDAFDANNNEEQNLTIGFDMKWTAGGETTGYESNPFVFGTPDPVSVTVAKKAASTSNIKLYYDEVKDANAFGSGAATFTGAAHKVVASSVEGYTTTFEVYSNGSWAAGDVSVTNVGDSVTFKVVVKDAKGNVVTPSGLTGNKTATVTARSANRPTVGFDTDYDGNIASSDMTSSNKYGFTGGYFYVEQGYDATKLVKVTARIANGANEPTDEAKAVAAATEAELLAYFNDFYEIKKTTKKAYPDVETLTIARKTLSTTEVTALQKKYDQLRKNLGLTWSSRTNVMSDLSVTPTTTHVIFIAEPVVSNDKEDDITFSGVTTKAFKAKKKTKKLAKTKSFQIAAVADSGNAITFSATSTDSKITVSADGKVTVKKGLKKGTYKVTVKAKTAAGNGYKAAKETNVYTIKIK
jgi:hypothetical protein